MDGPVVITGGGTGGHVFPMQAISDALRSRGLRASDLRFVGSRRGQERALLGDGDVALTLLPGRGVRRSMRPYDLCVNVVALFGLVVAMKTAFFLVRRWRPSVVVSVGGYASLATGVAALCWRIPLVLVEFDATPGAAHRVLARFATTRCCAFPTEGENVVVTGAPLRKAIEQIERSKESRDRAKGGATPPIDEGRGVVVVMTGSLGARRVNDAVSDLAVRWSTRHDRALLHVSGRRDYARVLSKSPGLDGLDYRIMEFGDMVQLWAMCDVAICRAGAMTIAELTALSIPSILVPLPGAPGDHQTKNALALVGAGGAVLVPDADCTGEALEEALERLMKPEMMLAASRGASTLARRDAASAIAEVVLGLRGTP